MNISTQSLRDYLRLANIYKVTSTKKKTDLVEMIVYGHISNKINKNDIQDISVKCAEKILNESDIVIKPLPGYDNDGLKNKSINIHNNNNDDELSIK